MATKKNTEESTVSAPETAAETEKAAEPTYTLSEFETASKKLFNTMPECVTAAFKAAGRTSATISEAKELVTKFMEKGVK